MTMKNKLKSLNFSISLVVEDVQGHDQEYVFTGILPSQAFKAPSQVVNAIREFIASKVGPRPQVIPEPERIKAHPASYEKIIQEIMPT